MEPQDENVREERSSEWHLARLITGLRFLFSTIFLVGTFEGRLLFVLGVSFLICDLLIALVNFMKTNKGLPYTSKNARYAIYGIWSLGIVVFGIKTSSGMYQREREERTDEEIRRIGSMMRSLSKLHESKDSSGSPWLDSMDREMDSLMMQMDILGKEMERF